MEVHLEIQIATAWNQFPLPVIIKEGTEMLSIVLRALSKHNSYTTGSGLPNGLEKYILGVQSAKIRR